MFGWFSAGACLEGNDTSVIGFLFHAICTRFLLLRIGKELVLVQCGLAQSK